MIRIRLGRVIVECGSAKDFESVILSLSELGLVRIHSGVGRPRVMRTSIRNLFYGRLPERPQTDEMTP